MGFVDQVAHVHNPIPCVVPAGTLNQFYIGCLENKKDVTQWVCLVFFSLVCFFFFFIWVRLLLDDY